VPTTPPGPGNGSSGGSSSSTGGVRFVDAG
jgi:hypothetical protein